MAPRKVKPKAAAKPPSLRKVARAVRKASRPMKETERSRAVEARELLVKATGALLSEKGFHGITLDRAARRAGVSSRLARALFRTSLHLVAATLEEQLEEDIEATEGDILGAMHARENPAHGIKLMLVAQLRRHAAGGWWRLYLDMDLLAKNGDSRDVLHQLQVRLRERALSFITAMQARGLIHDGHDAEAVWFLWSALLDGAVLRARVSPAHADVDTLAELLAPLLANGISPPKK